MKRLYLLIPDVGNARKIFKAFLGKGIREEDMHLVVKNHEKLELSRIPQAGVIQTTDVLHALVQGMIVGLIAGVLAGVAAVLFPPEGLVLGVGTVIALSIFGIFFGAWVSTLVGVAIPNPTLKKFEEAVEAGGILMLVDVPDEKEKDLLEFMQSKHPETTLHGSGLSTKMDPKIQKKD